MKISLEGLNSKFELAEERISKLEGMAIVIMHSEDNRGKRMKKMNRASEKHGKQLSVSMNT